MTLQRESLLDEIADAQKRIANAMHRADPFLLQLDLTIGQLKGLIVLADSAMTIGQLADVLGIGKPAASILVEHLVKNGWVERIEDPADRRRTIARLTAPGDEFVARLRQGGRDRFRGWLDQLDDDDLAALAGGLRALAAIIADECALAS